MNNRLKMRICALFLVFMLCYTLVFIKLYFIQIRNNQFFANRAEQQYHVTVVSTPERAQMYDRHGQPLAINKDAYSAFVVPNDLKDRDATMKFLKKKFPAAAERLEQQRKNPSSFMFIKRKISDEQKTEIENAHLKDVHILKEPSRFYPIDGTGPIIGITDIDNKGSMGLELYCNELLAGKPTIQVLERDARSGHFYFSKEVQEEGVLGRPVTLTLDATLQYLAYQALQETMQTFNSKEGAVIVMDPTNGDILAMVNYPDFDANTTNVINFASTKNKIVTECYELGSVMKTFLALAALDEGVATPDTIIDCENVKSITLQGIKVNTWKEHGKLTLSEIIEHSNNIGTTKVALQVNTKLYDHYRKCGFGSKTNITFPGEQKGYVTHPSTWSRQSLASLSFGYETNATLLQLVCAFCMIANNGVPVQPRLILSPLQSCPVQQKPLYNPETMRLLREILSRTTSQGTAKKAAIKGYTVMGKTGTANLLVNGEYQPDRNIFTFAGIIEKDSYKRVIVTFVKESQKKDIYASTVAAPLFEHVAEKMLINDKIL